MSDLREAFAELACRVGGLEAALIFEESGIGVVTWGTADFELVTAELAEAWSRLSSAEIALVGESEGLDRVEIGVDGRTWLVLSLGSGYLLGFLVGSGGFPGKARFYAAEWVKEHREDFA